MNNEDERIITVSPFGPARLTAEHTAVLLNFAVSDIPILVRHRVLKPLGNPSQTSVRYFARVKVLELANDPDGLSKATAIVQTYHREKNLRRSSGQ